MQIFPDIIEFMETFTAPIFDTISANTTVIIGTLALGIGIAYIIAFFNGSLDRMYYDDDYTEEDERYDYEIAKEEGFRGGMRKFRRSKWGAD